MAKGGMRFGAGRPGSHVKAEHFRRIDARHWARAGILQSRCGGAWAWTDPDTCEQKACISFQSDGATLRLTFNMNDRPMRQQVPILTTGCTYGGLRYWFGCPRCGGRVAILYLRNLGFGCRKCCRVVYASQSEGVIGRAWRKQRKVEAKLGDGCVLPKGMHLTTYERLMKTIIECEHRKGDELVALVRRMGWRL